MLIGTAGSFSKGEHAALVVFFEHDADAILTDDWAFLRLLARSSVPALMPAAVIVRLMEAGKMSRAEAREALERIKTLIRSDTYEAALKEIESAGGEAGDD